MTTIALGRTLALNLAPGPSTRFVLRRLLAAIPLLLAVSALVFWMISLLPGNTAQQLLGIEATDEQVARLASQLHLDRPPIERYVQWLGNAVQGDFGRSLTSGQRISTLLLQRFPVTLELVGLSLLLAIGFAVPVALLAARRPNGIVD